MPKRPIADDVIYLIDEMILAQGQEVVFCTKGDGHLYSGPDVNILKSCASPILVNHERAEKWKTFHPATLIDDTPAGTFLSTFDGKGIYGFFKDAYAPDLKTAYAEADKVMRYASRRFVEELWGHVTTSICGALRTRIFYDTELPTALFIIPELIRKLVKTRDIDTIGKVPTKIFRSISLPKDYEKAFTFISTAQARHAIRVAWDLGSSEVFGMGLGDLELHYVDQFRRSAAPRRPPHPLYGMTPKERFEWRTHKIEAFLDAKIRGFGYDPKVSVWTGFSPTVSSPA